MRRASAVLLLVTACGAAQRPSSSVAVASVVFVVDGGVLVPLACAGARGDACLARVHAGAKVRTAAGVEGIAGPAARSRCDGGRSGLGAGALSDGVAVAPPGAAALAAGVDPALSDAERARIVEQLARTDPSAAGKELIVRRVLREDLDGDGVPDAAFAVAAGGLDALLLAASTSPVRLRILQFSDGEPYDLLAAVDLEPEKPGRELVLKSRQSDGAVYEVVRATGELVGRAHCLTSP